MRAQAKKRVETEKRPMTAQHLACARLGQGVRACAHVRARARVRAQCRSGQRQPVRFSLA